MRLLYDLRPDEVYNLAAQSHVRVSFDIPEYTSDITATGALRLLESIRHTGIRCRFYQASSSEMYGSAAAPQSEETPFHPRSPYACAKLFAHSITVNYRESYGMFAVSGILFNHESPRRGETFVTRKIARAAAHIKARAAGEAVPRQSGREARLGLRARVRRSDVAHAAALDAPHDFVIGTGEMHSVREFVELAFARRRASTGALTSPSIRATSARPKWTLCRRTASKAKRVLEWEHKVGFEELVRIMVEAEMEDIRRRQSGVLKPVNHFA
jgi:GDPmannose 4,6-dehydratase